MDKQVIVNEVQALIKKITENNLTFDTLQSLTELYPKGDIEVRTIDGDFTDVEINAGIVTFDRVNDCVGRTGTTYIVNDIMLSHNAEFEIERGYLVPSTLYITEQNNNMVIDYVEDIP